MKFDLEEELESVGIDAFEFSLMDDEEKYEALYEAGLDPEDFDGIEFERSFDDWLNLQDAGLSIAELKLMDEEEKREALEEAGLDPDDYDMSPDFFRTRASVRSGPLPQTPPRKTWRYCQVRFPGVDTLYHYRADGLELNAGDLVEVPAGYDNKPFTVEVVSVDEYEETDVPYPLDKTKNVIRKVAPAEPVPDAVEPDRGTRPAGDSAEEPAAQNHAALQPSGVFEPEKTEKAEQVDEKPRDSYKLWLGIIALFTGIVLLCVFCLVPTARRTFGREKFESLREDFLNSAEAEYPKYFDAALARSPYQKYVDHIKVSLDSSFEKPHNYNFFEIDDSFTVRIFIRDEINSWLDQDKHPLLCGLDIVAANAVSAMCHDRFQEYTAYDWLELRDLYGEGVFPERHCSATIVAGPHSYEAAQNVGGQYFVMDGKDHWYKLVPSEEEKTKLSHMLPYVGMPEEYIQYTLVGEPDERNFDLDSLETTLIWRAGNGRDCPLTVIVADRKVKSVTKNWEGLYWTSDGRPNFYATSDDKARYYRDRNIDFSRIGKYDDYDADDYEDPEDFWYDHADEFEDYEDAWDYWEENH